MERRKNVTIEGDEIISTDKSLTLSQIKLKRQYMIDVAIFHEQKFAGNLIPIPEVLVKYLTSSELRIFTIILGQLKDHATSIIRRSSIAQELGVTPVTVSMALASLENMGIIIQTRNGRRKNKNINFEAIQKLNNLLADKKPGAVHAFRRAMGDHNVMTPTPSALALLDIKFTERDDVESEEYI